MRTSVAHQCQTPFGDLCRHWPGLERYKPGEGDASFGDDGGFQTRVQLIIAFLPRFFSVSPAEPAASKHWKRRGLELVFGRPAQAPKQAVLSVNLWSIAYPIGPRRPARSHRKVVVAWNSIVQVLGRARIKINKLLGGRIEPVGWNDIPREGIAHKGRHPRSEMGNSPVGRNVVNRAFNHIAPQRILSKDPTRQQTREVGILNSGWGTVRVNVLPMPGTAPPVDRIRVL